MSDTPVDKKKKKQRLLISVCAIPTHDSNLGAEIKRLRVEGIGGNLSANHGG